MARKCSAEKELDDMTECSICTESFTDHRVLPCTHTFCLKCLLNYGKDRRPGDSVPCPVCRKEFAVPDNGLAGTQKNFFMDKLVEVVSKLAVTTCGVDKGKEIEVFCRECKLVLCTTTCFIKSHKTHDCSDIDEASVDLRKQVKSDADKVGQLLKKTGELLRSFEKKRNDLASHFADIKGEINAAADNLVAVVERDRVKLLSEVESIKLEKVKQLEKTKQEVEKHMAAFKSFKRYSETFLSDGTACDVARSLSWWFTRQSQ